MRRKHAFLLVLWIGSQACASNRGGQPNQMGLNFVSPDLKKQLNQVSESVVALETIVKYEIQKFRYEKQNGQFIKDPRSPVAYRLQSHNGDSGIIIEEDRKTLTGGGLIIYRNFQTSKYAILTSNHLVAPRDTTDIYYLDNFGTPTDVVFARYLVKSVVISVRVKTNWRVRADLVAADSAIDVALIELNSQTSPGIDYGQSIDFGVDLSWGDWVFIFGYPKGIKQLTGGWVSRGPYRSTLAVDAVVRFGFSGGPVFAITQEKRDLSFVGLIKSVPRSSFEYVAPDGTLPVGYALSADEVQKLVVKSEQMVDYGTAYFVHPQAIQKFFSDNRAKIDRAGIHLSPAYYR